MVIFQTHDSLSCSIIISLSQRKGLFLVQTGLWTPLFFYPTVAWPPVGLSMPTMSASIIAQWPEEGGAAAWQRRLSSMNHVWITTQLGVKVGSFPFFKPCGVNYFYYCFFFLFFFFCLRYAKLPTQEGKKRSKGKGKGRTHLMSPYVKSMF